MGARFTATQAVEPKDTANDKNFLIMGPWFHSQINREGTLARPAALGPRDTTLDDSSRHHQAVLRSVPEEWSAKANTPPVTIYNTGENRWDHFFIVAARVRIGLPVERKPLYLRERVRLVVRRAGSGERCGLRRIRVGSREARAVYAAADAVRRFRRMAALARHRSTNGRGSA